MSAHKTKKMATPPANHGGSNPTGPSIDLVTPHHERADTTARAPGDTCLVCSLEVQPITAGPDTLVRYPCCFAPTHVQCLVQRAAHHGSCPNCQTAVEDAFPPDGIQTVCAAAGVPSEGVLPRARDTINYIDLRSTHADDECIQGTTAPTRPGETAPDHEPVPNCLVCMHPVHPATIRRGGSDPTPVLPGFHPLTMPSAVRRPARSVPQLPHTPPNGVPATHPRQRLSGSGHPV